MADITMDLVKKLREKTKVGLMDCKKALQEANGDIEKAIEILRKKGAAVAAKRAEHATNEGVIAGYISDDYTIGALTEVGCETDFSANTDAMKEFCTNLITHVAQSAPASNTIEDLLAQPMGQTKLSIQETLNELIAKISENIKITNFARFTADENGFVQMYIHPGAHLGVMIELVADQSIEPHKQAVAQLAKDLCMQIAVTDPICVESSQLDLETLEKERAIFREQFAGGKKPPEIVEKIVEGKIAKYYEEVCLLNQKFIKDEKQSIQQHIQAVGGKIGTTISIKRFVRFAIGKD
jgi:elongation factor Ts